MDHHIDAKGKTLGRLATEIALILQGKKDPKFAPNKVGGDRVIVKNADKVVVTGNKLNSRVYYRHTGYMGHLKEQTLGEKMAKKPEQVLRDTVRHMLPKNFLNQKRLNNLIFAKDGE